MPPEIVESVEHDEDAAYTERHTTLDVFNRNGSRLRLHVDQQPDETLQLGIGTLTYDEENPDEATVVWFRKADIDEIVQALETARDLLP